MGIDVRQSRRIHPFRCIHYSSQYSRQEVLEKEAEPTGVFYAQHSSAYSTGKDEWQNVIRRDRVSTNIMTMDDVNIKVDDWIIFEQELWIVDSVSYEGLMKNEFLAKRPGTIYYIGIRK
jgi:hypothetical protein